MSAVGARRLDDMRSADVPDALIGRDGEVDRVARLIGSGSRMVTIVGPGGMGETRLADAVVNRCAEQFDDTVVVVLAAGLRDDGMLAAIASAAGVAAGPSVALDAALTAWAGRRTLLVLDNVEQARAAIGPAIELFQRSPRMQLLATSRVPVGLPGEVVAELRPLALPDADAGDLELVGASAAVQLFVAEGRRADPRFALRPSNAADVVAICRALDGVPLALELAAARLRVLSAPEVADGLQEGFALIDSAGTLRRTIEWTVGGLAAPARRLLRRLAVMHGFTVASASAVAELDRADTLDGLDSLLRANLIHVVSAPDAARRFEMFESVKLFALDEAATLDETRAGNAALGRWAVGLATEQQAKLYSNDAGLALQILDREVDNLRNALGRLVAEGAGSDADRLATALGWYWRMRGSFAEGCRQLEDVIAHGQDDGGRARGDMHLALVDLAIARSNYALTEHHLAAAHQRFAELDDDLGWARCAKGDGIVALHRGDHGRADECFAAAGAVFDRLGDLRRCADIAADRATVAFSRGDVETACAYAATATDGYRAIGARQSLARNLANLAGYLVAGGKPRHAVESLDEVVEIATELDDHLQLADALNNLAEARMTLGEVHLAEATGAEALAAYRKLGDRFGEAFCIQTLGQIAGVRGEFPEAGRRLLAALTLFDELGSAFGYRTTVELLADLAARVGEQASAVSLSAVSAHLRPTGRDGATPTVAIGEAVDEAALRVGPEAVAKLQAAAAQWERSTVVDHVTALVARLGTPPEQRRTTLERFRAGGLTSREIEIADQLMRGRTDAEIATELFISRRTVTSHVSTILRKLGARSRREVAIVANRRDHDFA